MPYAKPQATVFIDYDNASSPDAQPRNAHISGGLARLIRFAQSDEKEDGLLGYYDWLAEESFSWPSLSSDLADLSYAKLYVDRPILKYATYAEGAGFSITKTSGYTNRIRSSSVSFAENGDSFPLHASLLDRGVKVGDVIRVRSTPDAGDPVVVWTTVKSIVGDPVAATIDSAAADDANQADVVSASATATRIAGAANCVTLEARATSYDGLPSGFIEDTYRIRVTEGSVDGDFTTARVRVWSSDGSDDVLEVEVDEVDTWFEVGDRGLEIRFVLDAGASCSDSADDDSVDPNELIAGQEWQIEVEDEFAAPTMTSGGTYDSTHSTTYIIECTKGGLWADSPEVTVSTIDGYDFSGPTVVEDAGSSNAISIGTHGVTGYWDEAGLRKGDRWTIEVTGKSTGAMKTLVLANSLPDTIEDAEEVGIQLYILQSSALIPYGTEAPPATNYEVSSTEITVQPGIELYDSTWTDGGVQVALPLESHEAKGYGKLYIEARYWIQEGAGVDVDSVFVPSDALALPGPLSVDNPLKYGVYWATLNSNGVAVRYTKVADPSSLASWNAVLRTLKSRTDVYALAPMTFDHEVRTAFQGHVEALSAETYSRFRRTWLALEARENLPLVHAGTDMVGYLTATTEDGEVALGTFLDDPDTSGSQYTIVNVPAGNALFVTNGVAAGDFVRTSYVDDGFGNISYSSYEVAEVISEDELRLVSGPGAPVSVAQKIEVWRSATAPQEAAAVALQAGVFSNSDGLVSLVFPDEVEAGTDIVPGYILAAAWAGLQSGILPHQGMTRLEISGPTAAPRITRRFDEDDLDVMAQAGICLLDQDRQTGTFFSRHCLTSAGPDAEQTGEEVVVRNAHDVARRVKELTDPYIGTSNVQPLMREFIERSINVLMTRLTSENATRELGGQITTLNSVSVTIPEGQQTGFETEIDADFPGPTNTIRNVLRVR